MTMQVTRPTTDPAPPAVDQVADAFWTGLLSGGGSTVLPRWTSAPTSGVSAIEAEMPASVLAGENLPTGDAVGDRLVTALLVAHAKVLAALTGEDEVLLEYRTADGRSLPLRADLGAQTWAELSAGVEATRKALTAHRDYDVAALAERLGVELPTSETVVDLKRPVGEGTGLPSELLGPGGPVVAVSLRAADSDRLRLRLDYRQDVWDQAMAQRVLGYHLAALKALASAPDRPHRETILLSQAERELQLNGMSGPDRELPQVRFHELVEQIAARHPDRVAARHAGTQWTYRQVNEKANQVAHALVTEGVGVEDVVAVVTERNLDWLAALLGILKAGAVYLPIEPHFPPGRFEATLSRSGCRLVLSEPESRENLDAALAALPGPIRVRTVGEVLAEGHPTHDPRTPVASDQVAYIYFTSGSTGLPKGAMCEHAGMVNHLFAKIDDLGITADSVVAQTAPQCFDISLWQLVAALAVGGSTLIVEQDAILDVPRFLQTLQDGRVSVVQLVPSYLEVVVSYLETNPVPLPDLVCVSATGEALKADLVRRWFAVMPQVKLVNAYGLTETSDDTNHEVMSQPPPGDRVPLGPPVNNVRIYLLDDEHRPVPLGAPGAIAFSGVCVGRGYINDPERTAAAYLADPFRPGERMYLAGDYGRWQADGKLDFLGRRDHQVKISGFRIEIGEIDNTLLSVPGVRDAAVVTATTPSGEQQLVAFYSADAPLQADDIRERLGQALPGYMVPQHIHYQPSLPLTGNGKIDRKALTALAERPTGPSLGGSDASGADSPEPGSDATELNPTEHRVAQAWAKILGIPLEQIARTDNFYDRGGSSLLAVKLVIALERMVTLRELTAHPVLEDQARLLEACAAPEATGMLQALTDTQARRALVCLPYAGGNAVNYVPLARALEGGGIAVYAAELPGHDPAAPGEAFGELAQVVEGLATEITALRDRTGLDSVLLYGHSLGTAATLALASRLERAGVPVERVFLGAQLLRTAQRRRASLEDLAGRSNAAVTAQLSGDGGHPDLADLDEARTEHVGAAFRHDHDQAQRHLIGLLEMPLPPRLRTPVTVVAAADDPSTEGHAERYLEWELLAERVDLSALPDGGHYFLRTRPEQLARVIREAAGPMVSPDDRPVPAQR